ncbi:MAG: 4-hydroxy-3-methylbut-2-enyl diphosphate reductase, partial [Negativicutes bacterium]
MEVILADYLGFCYGVKRAIHMARSSAQPGPARTLGPIIHNPQMVSRLAAEGVEAVNSLAETPGEGTVIIRSHGVGPQVYEEAKERDLRMVDATCPHVKKAQMAAHQLSQDGFSVVIVGEKKHPEVKSIFEWSGRNALVVETEEEAAQIAPCDKLGIVAQTTFSGDKFQSIVACLLNKSNDIH